MIEPLADRSARMDEGELFGLIARFFDERCLQRVEDHAEGRRGRRTLRVPLVRLAVHMLLEHDVRCLRQRRFQILCHRDDRHALGFADVHDGQQLLRLAAAGGEDHHVALLQKAGRAVDGLGWRNKPSRPLDAAHEVRKVLADDAGMSAACSADARGLRQQMHCPRKRDLVEIILHLLNALRFDVIRGPCRLNGFHFHRISLLRFVLRTV